MPHPPGRETSKGKAMAGVARVRGMVRSLPLPSVPSADAQAFVERPQRPGFRAPIHCIYPPAVPAPRGPRLQELIRPARSGPGTDRRTR
jgi:hypothetical protein